MNMIQRGLVYFLLVVLSACGLSVGSNGAYLFAPGGFAKVQPSLGQAPTARSHHSANVIDGKLYIFGGYDRANTFEGIDNKYFNDLHVYDPFQNSWKVLNPSGQTPEARYNHLAEVIGTELYIWGGLGECNYVGKYCDPNDLFVYNTRENSWTRIDSFAPGSAIPTPRKSPASLVYRGRILMFGGSLEQAHTSRNDFYIYDPERNLWEEIHSNDLSAPGYPSKRGGAKIFFNNNQVYLFGGRDSDGDDMNDLFSFDPNIPESISSWRRLLSHDSNRTGPSGRGHTVGHQNNTTYVFGGGNYGAKHDGNITRTKVFKFNSTQNRWDQVNTSLSIQRHAPSFNLINGLFYIFGGENSNEYWGDEEPDIPAAPATNSMFIFAP